MKNFEFRPGQLVRIVAALTADELSRRFGRYTETLTLSKWGEETALGTGGVAATAEQIEACGARMAQFFGHEAEELGVTAKDTFGSIAERLAGLIRDELTDFRFHPATPAGFVDTRHNADDIFQDAGAVASLMQGRRRVVSLVSPHSLMGLVSTVMAPNLLGFEVIDARHLGPDELSSTVSFGDIVIATPTLWRYLADTLPGLANNVMGMTFGERFGPDLAARLRSRGIGAMRELYGSTESGVIGWRDSPPDPFVLFGHWTREGDKVIRKRSNGLSHAMLPMDNLEWQEKNTFELGGRRDGAVQIGAINVFPNAIAAIIEEHEDVVSCSVRVSQRPGALDRLIADITLKEGSTSDQGMAWSIDEICRKRLRPPERPRIYSFFIEKQGGPA
ncbi:hypothetical protein [Parvularcula marina]|uniref:Uncharacterized protein n=1 Tax=Parvularcula marina TaxID=2292771 RepID=A0A371RJZ7_9PROT|nr:hypothetical protein [Parvularcula marina]RFB05773.1 hypothetical protein DX908_11140 [Parvularcula marina]